MDIKPSISVDRLTSTGRHVATRAMSTLRGVATVGKRRGVAVTASAALVLVAASPAASAAGGSLPVGFLDGVSSTTGVITAQGWTLDPDTTSPIDVHLYVDGSFVTAVQAAESRPDIAASFGKGDLHGFTATFAALAGTHRVCAYAINTPVGLNPEFGCRTVVVRNAQPMGFLDLVTSTVGTVTASGWSLDPDTSSPIAVQVNVDGVPVIAGTADGSRPDVAAAYGMGDKHGYAITFNVGGGSHRICTYGLNAPIGANSELGCSTVVAQNADPIGYVDTVAAASGSLTVAGWALDPDTSQPIDVNLTVDGRTVASVSANGSRPDVAAAFNRGAQHGFSTGASVTAGVHQLCVVAINAPVGTDPQIGCSSVSVPSAQQAVSPPSPPGAPGLSVYDGDLTVTTPGTVIDGLDVRGYLRIKAANVTIKNSIIRGRSGLTSPLALVLSSSPGVQIIDTEIVAAYPTAYIDGIIGNNFALTRVNIHGVVDSVKITGDNVTVVDSWLHDTLYFVNDPTRAGAPSHDDNVQIQAGSHIRITGTTLTGTHNAAIMITQDAGKVSDFVFSGNTADNGACTINIAEKSYGPIQGVQIINNTFGTGTVFNHCAITAPATTSTISTIKGNVFTDGSAFKSNNA